MATKKKDTGDIVELADKHTGFYDQKTKLKLVHDQRVALGPTVGEETRQALLSGRLLIVIDSKAEDEGPQDDYDIPEDLPGRDAFVAAGLTAFDDIKALDTDEKLLAVKGIGPGTVKNLKAWVEANALKE